MAVVSYFLSKYADIDLGNAAHVGVALGSLYVTATKYAKNEGTLPPSNFSWKFSAYSTILMIAISFIITFAYAFIYEYLFDVSVVGILETVPLKYFAFGLIFVFVLYFLLARFVFPRLVKSNLKIIEKQKNNS